MSLTNFLEVNTINANQKSATLNVIGANPGGVSTIWINSANGNLTRDSTDLETISFPITAASFVPTFTALETHVNTYTNLYSCYLKQGNIMFIYSIFSIVMNALTTNVIVNVTYPIACTTTPTVAFTNVFALDYAHIDSSKYFILAGGNDTNTILQIQNSGSLRSSDTYYCTAMYSYVIN